MKITEVENYFEDKVIWITGASSGIGEHLAYAFSENGAKLILSSRRLPELERVKKDCRHPSRVHILPMDLSETLLLENNIPLAINCFGQIDIMVHNAGVSQCSLVVDTDITVHRTLMELDYFSYVILTKALIPHFLERKRGHFVVMSSVMGKIGTPMRSAYAAAKHALHGFFDCLRAEVFSNNIKVSILTPGYIRTNIAASALDGKGEPMNKLSKHIEQGLSPKLAADRMLKAIERNAAETYIGKLSLERIGLWVRRFLPELLFRIAPRLVPK